MELHTFRHIFLIVSQQTNSLKLPKKNTLKKGVYEYAVKQYIGIFKTKYIVAYF